MSNHVKEQSYNPKRKVTGLITLKISYLSEIYTLEESFSGKTILYTVGYFSYHKIFFVPKT